MPIWLRNFTFNKIQEWFNKRKEQEEKAAGKMSASKPKIDRPDIRPDYSVKASKV